MLKKLAVIILALALLAGSAACAGQTGSSASQETGLSGKVVIDGSGTVFPLMAHIAEIYMTKEKSNVDVQVGRAGSSAGFKKFIPGETDFSDASRQIKQEEIDQLTEKGLAFGDDVYEFKLALDGLTFVINKENDWAASMSKDELVDLFLAGTYRENDAVLWSDVRAEWPAE